MTPNGEKGWYAVWGLVNAAAMMVAAAADDVPFTVAAGVFLIVCAIRTHTLEMRS